MLKSLWVRYQRMAYLDPVAHSVSKRCDQGVSRCTGLLKAWRVQDPLSSSFMWLLAEFSSLLVIGQRSALGSLSHWLFHRSTHNTNTSGGKRRSGKKMEVPGFFSYYTFCKAFLLEYHSSSKKKNTDQTTLIENLVTVTFIQNANFVKYAFFVQLGLL